MKKVLLAAVLVAAACGFLLRPSILRAQGTGGGYRDLSPSEARELIGKRSGDPGFVLLDVRTRKEFEDERIEGAVLVDFLSPTFRDEIAKLDRGKTYIVYCRTGSRTKGALKAMLELGFKDLFHLDGGITKWKEAGFPAAR